MTNDGVSWDYSYVPGPDPYTKISQATITAPLGFSRTVNIYQTAVVRPRITSIVNSSAGDDIALVRDDSLRAYPDELRRAQPQSLHHYPHEPRGIRIAACQRL